MPLKVKIKPRGKFWVNDAVMQNIGSQTIELLILSDHKFAREEYKEVSSGSKFDDKN